MRRALFSVLSLLLLIAGIGIAPIPLAAQGTPTAVTRSGPQDVILATTTSTADTGLLDALAPLFKEATGYTLKPIAVGSGAALALGEAGDADVVLAHSPQAEADFMAAGFGEDRRTVMYNDFVIVGPATDPAKIKGEKDAVAALGKIISSKSKLVIHASNGASEQSLAGAWRSDEENTLRNAATELLEFLRVFQEFDDFLELFFGFVCARYIFEGDFLLLCGEQPSTRLAEAEGFVAASLHLTHQEQAETNEEEERQSVQQNNQPVAAADFLHFDEDRFIAKLLGEIGSGFFKNSDVEFLVGLDVFALQLIAVGREIHGDLFDVALIHVGHEFAEARLVFASRLAVGRHKLPEHDSEKHDREPEQNGFCCRTGIHFLPLLLGTRNSLKSGVASLAATAPSY